MHEDWAGQPPGSPSTEVPLSDLLNAYECECRTAAAVAERGKAVNFCKSISPRFGTSLFGVGLVVVFDARIVQRYRYRPVSSFIF